MDDDAVDQRRRRVRLECAFGYLTVSDQPQRVQHLDSPDGYAPRPSPPVPLRSAFGAAPIGGAHGVQFGGRTGTSRTPPPVVIVRRRTVPTR